jgi:hypothetical protein
MSARLPPHDYEDVPFQDGAADTRPHPYSAAFVAQAAGQSLPERKGPKTYAAPIRRATGGRLCNKLL